MLSNSIQQLKLNFVLFLWSHPVTIAPCGPKWDKVGNSQAKWAAIGQLSWVDGSDQSSQLNSTQLNCQLSWVDLQQFFFLKTVCTLFDILLFSRYHESVLAKNRCIVFKSFGVNYIGLYEFAWCGSTIVCFQSMVSVQVKYITFSDIQKFYRAEGRVFCKPTTYVCEFTCPAVTAHY